MLLGAITTRGATEVYGRLLPDHGPNRLGSLFLLPRMGVYGFQGGCSIREFRW